MKITISIVLSLVLIVSSFPSAYSAPTSAQVNAERIKKIKRAEQIRNEKLRVLNERKKQQQRQQRLNQIKQQQQRQNRLNQIKQQQRKQQQQRQKRLDQIKQQQRQKRLDQLKQKPKPKVFPVPAMGRTPVRRAAEHSFIRTPKKPITTYRGCTSSGSGPQEVGPACKKPSSQKGAKP